MRSDVLVSVLCYAGDADRVKQMMPYYQHHERTVLVLSPVDAPVLPGMLDFPTGVIYSYAGREAYIGDLSLDRFRQQMETLLNFPHEYFFINDSDSFCVAKEFPEHFFDDVFWSGEVSDSCHSLPNDWPYPRLAFQMPYFCSRRVLQAMMDAAPRVDFRTMGTLEHPMPYIDHYVMRLVDAAGVQHKTHPGDGLPHASGPEFIEEDKARRIAEVMAGSVMLHPVKTPEVVQISVEARAQYEKRHQS